MVALWMVTTALETTKETQICTESKDMTSSQMGTGPGMLLEWCDSAFFERIDY